MIKRLLLLCLMASLFATIPVGSASACSCVVLDVESALVDYDAAFVGRLVERPPDQGEFLDNAPYLFEVDRWVKGDFGETMVVLSATNGAACGFEIPLGQAAGVFVTFDDGTAFGGLCSTTDAESMLAAALDEPIPADSPEAPSAEPSGSSAAPDPGLANQSDPDRWAFVLFGLVGVAGLVFVVIRQTVRRRSDSLSD